MGTTYIDDKRRYTSIPIMKYVLLNDVDSIKKLLNDAHHNESNVIQFVYKKSGDSPLILAARYKQYDILKLLVECGADVEHKNLDGKRALHEASCSGSLDCCRYLLEKGATVDVLKRGDWTPLMMACCQGHLQVVKQLVGFGGNVNRINKDGWNCFHLACRVGFTNILKYLLEVDNNVWNVVSKNGRTPLHTAAMHGQTDVVKFLLDKCDYGKDETDSCGTTPLMDAFRFGFIDVAELLITIHDSDIHKTDMLGRQAIHISAQSGQLHSILSLVKDRDVDINVRCDKSNATAIHFAAKEGHIDVLKSIVLFGGLINDVDKNGRTPLHLAVAANMIQMVKVILFEYSGDRTILDINGKHPVDYALSDEMKSCF